MIQCHTPPPPLKTTLPYYNTPDFTPLFIDRSSQVLEMVPHVIDTFSLWNEKQQLYTRDSLVNRVHIANFMFTQCGGICPRLTQHIQIVSDSLVDFSELRIISYSVTPWTDTPTVLSTYKKNHGIQNPNWHFLTGKASTIYTLARQSYFAEEEIGFTKDSSDFLHTEHLLLIDQSLRIRGIYNGTLKTEIHQLIKDARILLSP